MLGRAYSIRSRLTGISAADDLIQVTAASTHIIAIDKIKVTQGSILTAEFQQLLVQRASAAGTGGTITPEEQEPGGQAAASTWLQNTSTNATLTGAPYDAEEWNFLIPYQWHPKEGKEIVVPPSGILVVRLNTAPSGAIDLEVVVEFREIG